MITTLQNFLRELTFVQIADIQRHAKGLLIALEKSNRKEMLEYKIKSSEKKNYITCGSCEIRSPEPTEDGECPNCRSGNWVWGDID